jgi:hypothetical protein
VSEVRVDHDVVVDLVNTVHAESPAPAARGVILTLRVMMTTNT